MRIRSIPKGFGPVRSGHTVRPIAFFDNLVGTIVASIASVPAPGRKPTGWWPTLSARDLENANRLRPTVVWVGFGDVACQVHSGGGGDADKGLNNVAKLLRACGGCLGARRRKGVEDCDKPGGAVKRVLIPGYPSQPRELKHLSTWRKRKQQRLR